MEAIPSRGRRGVRGCGLGRVIRGPVAEHLARAGVAVGVGEAQGTLGSHGGLRRGRGFRALGRGEVLQGGIAC